MDSHDREHDRRLTAYQRQIERIFDAALKDAARLGLNCDTSGMEQLFAIGDHPEVKRQFERLMKKVAANIEAVVTDGVTAEWQLANDKNDALALQVLGQAAQHLTEAQRRRYFNNHEAARKAFQNRKEAGLNLSDRVWRYTDQFKEEIEMGLDCGLRDGLTAPEMARQLKQYLQHPDALFRRVRDEHGLLQLSRRAKAYHPGQGVYRSAYINARRLADTETNIAYRTADHDRQQDLDFVVGIEVHLSTNHTVKLQAGEKINPDDPLYNDPKRRAQSIRADGTPKAGAVRTLHDVCDELAGRYPKTFKFTGWHPHCRCYTTTILKTPEEIAEDNRRLMRGEEPAAGSENEVCWDDDRLKNAGTRNYFKDWIEKNKERAKTSFSVPYFVEDNPTFFPKEFSKMYASRMPYPTYAEYEAAMKFNRERAGFTDEVRKNNAELSKVLPVVQGKIMSIAEADGESPNPRYQYEGSFFEGYHHNCQTCTVAYELRRRGFNVEALPNKDEELWAWLNKRGIKWIERFLNADGSQPKMKFSGYNLQNTIADKTKYIENETFVKGRYEIYCSWNKKEAHVFCLERQKNGNLLWYDPQSGAIGGASSPVFQNYLKRMRKFDICVMRLDNKLINPKFAERFKKSK